MEGQCWWSQFYKDKTLDQPGNTNLHYRTRNQREKRAPIESVTGDPWKHVFFDPLAPSLLQGWLSGGRV